MNKFISKIDSLTFMEAKEKARKARTLITRLTKQIKFDKSIVGSFKMEEQPNTIEPNIVINIIENKLYGGAPSKLGECAKEFKELESLLKRQDFIQKVNKLSDTRWIVTFYNEKV